MPTASWGRSFGKKAKGRGGDNTGEKGRCAVSGHLSITVPPPQAPTISFSNTLGKPSSSSQSRGVLSAVPLEKAAA